MEITAQGYYRLIIQDPSGRMVFMIKETAGWALPCVKPEEQDSWQDVEKLNRSVNENFGIEAITLRCIDVRYTSQMEAQRLEASAREQSKWVPPAGGQCGIVDVPEGHTLCFEINGVYAMEALTTGRTHGGEWIQNCDLQNLALTSQDDGIVLREWFTWVRIHRKSALRVPWFERGWFRQRAAWLGKELSLNDVATIGITQLRAWQRSAILRLTTNRGDLYYKEVPGIFSHEVYLSRELQRAFPHNFPTLIETDAERQAILMYDVSGVPLSRITEIKHWEHAVCCLAEIQIQTLSEAEHFLNFGCFDQRLDRILRSIDSVFSDTSALKAGSVWGMSDGEIEKLHSCLPKLKHLCVELLSYKIPNALEHGDLWPTNIFIKDETCIFLDWSDTSISHPFFSVPVLIQAAAESFPNFKNLGEHLRNLYLNSWTDYEPMAHLVRAFELSTQLAPLHHCMLYLRHLLPGMIVKWEMENMAPYFLKRVLQQI